MGFALEPFHAKISACRGNRAVLDSEIFKQDGGFVQGLWTTTPQGTAFIAEQSKQCSRMESEINMKADFGKVIDALKKSPNTTTAIEKN